MTKSLHPYRKNGLHLTPGMRTSLEFNPKVEGSAAIPIRYLGKEGNRLEFVGSVPSWVAGDGKLVFQAYIQSEEVRAGERGGLVVNLNVESEIIVAGPHRGQNRKIYNYIMGHLNS
ncbi:MAG: hypothetical protein Q8Q31_01930 [Nanoarchaeota archaeon]|nr:hypothetical protein [Nanoarchaeota archaeon]